MTGNLFFDCILLFLLCYAVVSIFYNLSDFLIKRYCKYSKKTFLVLEIKHGSEFLERDLRCAISDSLSQKIALAVVSDDLDLEEYKLIWRLTDSYSHIVLATSKNLSEKLDTLTDISVSQ